MTCLHDHSPAVLTKCFERLVMAHNCTSLPDNLHPLLFVCGRSRPAEGTISLALHTALYHLGAKNTYVRIVFSGYSSALNAKILNKLISNPLDPGLEASIYNWLLDF